MLLPVGLWKLRKNLCFQEAPWLDVRNLLLRIAAICCMPGSFSAQGEEGGFHGKIAEAERNCYKDNKDRWLSSVNDRWDLFMFKKALDWEDLSVPDTVKLELKNDAEPGNNAGRKWVNLLGHV